jgi:hypothetical protein
MRILSAKYGDQDITNLLNTRLINDSLLLSVNNDICGDPNPGVVKQLHVTWEYEGTIDNDSWKEGTICSIPKSRNTKLGIFYTNNHERKTFATIDKSLAEIKRAANGKADIFTCVWNRIPSNPFPEVLSWYKQSAHLTQVLQILQLLYTANELGRYIYVSFLEHDCLYGEGCFDYPEFDEGTVLCNMNYMGLCINGWQQRNQDDKPFSQITMRLTDAIKHFEHILPNAIVRNSGLVEPQIYITEWRSIVPTIHVNHGFHFTSHYSIYKRENPSKDIPYWGQSTNYQYLFMQ